MAKTPMRRWSFIAWCLGMVAVMSFATATVHVTPAVTTAQVVSSYLALTAGLFMVVFFAAMAVTGAWQEPWN